MRPNRILAASVVAFALLTMPVASMMAESGGRGEEDALAGVLDRGLDPIFVADTLNPGAKSIAGAASKRAGGPAGDVGFGMNGLYASDVERRSGVDFDYGQLWAGSWVGRPGGLAKFEGRVKTVHDRGMTPVVEWWYFGDQISTKAVTKGLPDGRSVAKWHALGPKMAEAACRASDGDVVLVVETEFNKGGVERLESFDGELAKHIRLLKEACPSARVVLGFGTWGAEHWGRFDRAAAAADGVGFMLLRSTKKDGREAYENGPDTLLAAATRLRELFGKPLYLHDIALSSHGRDGAALQERTLARILGLTDELEKEGVVLVLYRSVRDTPSMARNNYHGSAEAHWGLWTKGGRPKPAYDDWVAALRAA